MSSRRCVVVPSLIVFVVLGVSVCPPEFVRAQGNVPDWAESRIGPSARETPDVLKRPEIEPEILDRRDRPGSAVQERRASPRQRFQPKAGPPPPDGPENEVPLSGSGLVLLSAAGVGYAVRKLRRDGDDSDEA